jgi:hypothetical protein
MAYVYVLKAPGSPEPFYVGSTRYTLESRLKQHLGDIRSGRNKNRRFVRKAEQIGLDRIVIEAVHECEPHEQFILEYQTITAMLDKSIPLTNLVISGETYGTKVRGAVDEYWSADYLIEHIDSLGTEPPTAFAPRFQPLANQLHAVALQLVAEIERRTGMTAKAWLQSHAQT